MSWPKSIIVGLYLKASESKMVDDFQKIQDVGYNQI